MIKTRASCSSLSAQALLSYKQPVVAERAFTVPHCIWITFIYHFRMTTSKQFIPQVGKIGFCLPSLWALSISTWPTTRLISPPNWKHAIFCLASFLFLFFLSVLLMGGKMYFRPWDQQCQAKKKREKFWSCSKFQLAVKWQSKQHTYHWPNYFTNAVIVDIEVTVHLRSESQANGGRKNNNKSLGLCFLYVKIILRSSK